MPSWLELLVLALASTFWPTPILIVVLALRLDRPVNILVWFLIGGLLTTVSVGIAVVFALQDASFMTGSHPPADSAVDIVAGLLSLLAAFALSRRSRKTPAEVTPAPPEAPAEPKKPSMAQRAVSQGAPIAFVAGVVLNIVPGTFPIVALKDIAQLDASDGAKIATIIVFYVIMFAFVEIPIVAYLFAPARTITAVDNFNAWLGRNGRRVAVYVLAVVGAYLHRARHRSAAQLTSRDQRLVALVQVSDDPDAEAHPGIHPVRSADLLGSTRNRRSPSGMRERLPRRRGSSASHARSGTPAAAARASRDARRRSRPCRRRPTATESCPGRRCSRSPCRASGGRARAENRRAVGRNSTRPATGTRSVRCPAAHRACRCCCSGRSGYRSRAAACSRFPRRPSSDSARRRSVGRTAPSDRANRSRFHRAWGRSRRP